MPNIFSINVFILKSKASVIPTVAAVGAGTLYTHSLDEFVLKELNIGEEDGRGYLEDF